MTASLLRLRLNRPGGCSTQEPLRESINRICSIAAVHDLLSREELDEVNIKRVSETILTLTCRSFLRSDHRIVTTIDLANINMPASSTTSSCASDAPIPQKMAIFGALLISSASASNSPATGQILLRKK